MQRDNRVMESTVYDKNTTGPVAEPGETGPVAESGEDRTGSGPARRKWPWVAGAVVAVVAVVVGLGADHARQVTLREAQAHSGGGAGGVATNGRPAPGFYSYAAGGTERLSLPPLSQDEGPTVPGTVSLVGADCWVLRLDYSTHHWQTWRYCQRGADLWEMGGTTWQLWSVGPLDVTNLSRFTCDPGAQALPAHGSVGSTWSSRCTGTNSTIAGTTVTTGPYRLVGTGVLVVGGTRVPAVHFRRTRTDTGGQRGTERAEVWLDARTGLPLRLDQHLRVVTSTTFGTSTYTQDGTLRLTSITPVARGH